MSQRLADRFAACRAAKRTAFVGFITAGYPRLGDTVPAMLEMEKNGCDVIELGVPFSDPMADGSVIEAASVVALKNGVQYSDVLKYCKDARAKGLSVPVLMMGYYNSFLAAGIEETCKAAKEAGVDGFIIVDLPCEVAWRIMAPAAAANGSCPRPRRSARPCQSTASAPLLRHLVCLQLQQPLLVRLELRLDIVKLLLQRMDVYVQFLILNLMISRALTS
jgi:hypothetical protein